MWVPLYNAGYDMFIQMLQNLLLGIYLDSP